MRKKKVNVCDAGEELFRILNGIYSCGRRETFSKTVLPQWLLEEHGVCFALMSAIRAHVDDRIPSAAIIERMLQNAASRVLIDNDTAHQKLRELFFGEAEPSTRLHLRGGRVRGTLLQVFSKVIFPSELLNEPLVVRSSFEHLTAKRSLAAIKRLQPATAAVVSVAILS
jgi:hypothetical protein